MINGNVNEFVDHIHYGDELIFIFDGKKYFLQGLLTDGKYTLYLDRWSPPSDEYIWFGIGDDKKYPVNEFLDAKIWNGKNFWQAECDMKWVDD